MALPTLALQTLRRARSARWALALALLGLAAAPASAQVRLSQIYGGGGGSGAPWANDFVELFNPGAPQSLAGWSVQYASAAGATWQVTPLPAVVLDTGEHLLVRMAQGNVLVPPQVLTLPPSDANGSTSLSSSDGKVALVNTTTALGGATPTDPAIVDFVGYGLAAGWNESGAPFDARFNAPAPSNSTSIVRAGCGAQDTGDNSLDWLVAIPQPRSKALGATDGLGAGAMVQPWFAKPGATVRLVCEPFACDFAPLAGPTWASVDLTPLGLGPGFALVDDGTLGDAHAGDGVFSLEFGVPPAQTPGPVHLVVSFGDGARQGATFAALHVNTAVIQGHDNCSSAMVIPGPYTTPVTRNGSFAGASAEYNVVLASTQVGAGSMSSRRGLWFALQGTGTTLTFDTCASPLVGGSSIPDTVVMVYGGTCDALYLVAANDDSPVPCGTGSGTERRSSVSWCSLAGATYFVWLAPYAVGPQAFSYVATVSDSGVACNDAAPVSTCLPQAAALVAPEPSFGPGIDDGCNTGAGRFVELVAGPGSTSVRGTARSFGAVLDPDWMRFHAGGESALRASLRSQFAGVLELWELGAGGSCDGAQLVSQSAVSQPCGETNVVAVLDPAGWYALRVLPTQVELPGLPPRTGGLAPGGPGVAWRVALELGTPPPNDLCSAPELLALPGVATGFTNEFTGSDTSTACSAAGRDVWYSVTLPTRGQLVLDTCGSAVSTSLAVFDGCGGVELACVEGCGSCGPAAACLTSQELPAGTYLVRVADRGSVGSFTLSAQFLPSNDACLGATPLTLPANVVDSTSGATLDVGLPACVGPLGDQDFSVVAPGVWFSIALPTSSSAGALALSLDTLGSSFDTRLSVFQGDCGTLVPVTANDDIDASGASRVVFAASEGLTYSVLVHGAAGATGSFVLNAEVLDSPGNDDCGDAVQLSGDSGDVQGTLEGASGSAASYGSLALAPCGGPWGPFDVWYRFDATCTTELKLSTCGNFDTVLSVHTGCPGAFDAFALVGACNDDGDSSCAPGSSLTVQVNAGTAYFVRVAQRDGALPGDDFELEWETLDSDGDGTADCSDLCPNDPLKIAPGTCGCGVSDIDSDGDGTADCNDLCPNDPLKIAPGTCGCGVSDDDSDGDGTADCNDLCPNDPLKIAPGTCGCGIVDEDLDADGVVDCLDNCPTVANPSQGDCDLDGVGDACEIAAGALDTDLDGVPDACELGQVHTYCTAGTSTNGCVPTLSLSGPPSLSGAPFLVQASDLEGLKSSLLFYSLTGPRVQPWAPSSTSFLCINGPTQRTSARSTGGSAGLCDGSFALDLLLWGAANPSSLGVPFAPGDVFAAQVWYRDPPAPRGTNLSAAIQITFAP